MWFKRLLMVVLLLPLVACSSGKLVPTYEGERLASSELATLTVGENIALIRVNGKRVPEYLLSNISVNYGLKPGSNTLVFQYESVWAIPRADEDAPRSEAVSSELREVVVDVKAGQQLSFSYSQAGSIREARALADNFEASVVDQHGSVLGRSGDVTPKPVVQQVALAPGATAPTQSAAFVNNAPALPAADAIKVLWQKMSREEQKAFLQWAFQ